MFNAFLDKFFSILKSILEPVQVNYSQDLLANQIYDISILLFIMSLLITLLITILLINIVILINMDIVIKFFKNKFILWYLTWTKRFMNIEIFLLGITILYFMYNLSNVILFIATHLINLS